MWWNFVVSEVSYTRKAGPATCRLVSKSINLWIQSTTNSSLTYFWTTSVKYKAFARPGNVHSVWIPWGFPRRRLSLSHLAKTYALVRFASVSIVQNRLGLNVLRQRDLVGRWHTMNPINQHDRWKMFPDNPCGLSVAAPPSRRKTTAISLVRDAPVLFVPELMFHWPFVGL